MITLDTVLPLPVLNEEKLGSIRNLLPTTRPHQPQASGTVCPVLPKSPPWPHPPPCALGSRASRSPQAAAGPPGLRSGPIFPLCPGEPGLPEPSGSRCPSRSPPWPHPPRCALGSQASRALRQPLPLQASTLAPSSPLCPGEPGLPSPPAPLPPGLHSPGAGEGVVFPVLSLASSYAP